MWLMFLKMAMIPPIPCVLWCDFDGPPTLEVGLGGVLCPLSSLCKLDILLEPIECGD